MPKSRKGSSNLSRKRFDVPTAKGDLRAELVP